MENAEAVGVGAEFDYEVGAEVVEAATLFGCEGGQSRFGYPRCVRTAHRTVRKGESGG